MVFRVTVARSVRSDRKLWTGKPSLVRLVAAFFSAAVFLQCVHYGAVLHVLRIAGTDLPGPMAFVALTHPCNRHLNVAGRQYMGKQGKAGQ